MFQVLNESLDLLFFNELFSSFLSQNFSKLITLMMKEREIFMKCSYVYYGKFNFQHFLTAFFHKTPIIPKRPKVLEMCANYFLFSIVFRLIGLYHTSTWELKNLE